METVSFEITDYVANGSFASLKENVKTYKDKNYALFVRTVDIASGFKNDLCYIDKDSYDFLKKSQLFGGELMLSNIGASIGKVFIIPHLDIPMSLAPNSIIVRFFDYHTSLYFETVFKSFVGQEYLQFLSGGAAMPKFNKTDLRAMLVPVAPFDVQDKIVKKEEGILSLINSIEDDNTVLLDIISQAKSKILDLAIRGQLVPQDPDDEPASILLDRIRAEKEELMKQGKIKRDKKESVIFKGEDNSYYDNIPKNWEETSLLSIADVELGKTLDSAKNTGEPRKYLRSVNIRWNGIDLSDLKQMKIEPEEFERYTVHKGDLLICEGGDVGRCCIWEYDMPIIYQNALHRVRFYGSCSPKFFLYYMMHLESIGYLKRVSNGVTIKHLTKNVLASIPFLLPPIAEQYRIVDAIEESFYYLDTIADTLE